LVAGNCIRAILGLCFSNFVGYGLLRVILGRSMGRLSRLESLGYSFAVGLGAVGAYLIVLSVLRLRFSLALVLALAVIPLGSLLTGRGSASEEQPANGGRGVPRFCAGDLLPRKVSMVVIAVFVGLTFVGSLNEPIAEVDSAAAWALHAKVFFAEGTALPTYLTSGGCGRFVSHWPPLFPLMQASTYLAIGAFDDHAVKITFPFLFVALLGVVYGVLRRYLGGPIQPFSAGSAGVRSGTCRAVPRGQRRIGLRGAPAYSDHGLRYFGPAAVGKMS